MRREYFGFNEKVWSDEEWLNIAQQMKHSAFTRVRHLRMIAQAEHQSQRFSRIAFASGIFFFLAFLKFPVIRIQPGFRRLGLSGGLAYPIYYYVNSIGDEMKIKRSNDHKSQLRPLIASNSSKIKDITELQFDDEFNTIDIYLKEIIWQCGCVAWRSDETPIIRDFISTRFRMNALGNCSLR